MNCSILDIKIKKKIKNIKEKEKETHKQLRKRSLDKAQIDAQNKKLPFIPEHTSQADWDHIRQDKVYEIDLGDICKICIVAAARALKRDNGI